MTHLLLALALAGTGASTQHIVDAKLVGRYFTVQASINGTPGTFIVDTGAGLSCITPEAAKRMGVTGGMDVQAQGAGEERVSVKLTKFDTFTVGSATVKNDSLIIIDLPPALKCDGLVGYSFLKHFTVTLDYSNQKLIFDDPTSFKPTAGAAKLEMAIASGIPRVKGRIEGKEGWFNLDTGANGGITVMGPFAQENGLNERLKHKKPRIVGKGVGGFTMGHISRLESVVLGGVDFPNFPGVVSTQTKGVFASKDIIANVGAELLNRFTVSLDYAGKAAYFVQNLTFDRPYAVDRSGLWLDFDGAFKVVDVLPGSPADQAGVKVGDEVVAIGGKRLSEAHPLEVSKPLQQPAGTRVKLLLKSGPSERELELDLRDLY